MDFVVAGFGLGAVMMLIGFAVRDLGPLRYRGSEHDASLRRQWVVLCRTVGNAIVTGGFSVCLVTLVLLFADAGDDFGARMVASISAIAVIVSGVWSVFAIRRFAEATVAMPEGYGAGRAGSPFGPARRGYRAAGQAVWEESEADSEIGEAVAAGSGERSQSWPVRSEPEQPQPKEEKAVGATAPTPTTEAPVIGPPVPVLAATTPAPAPTPVPEPVDAAPKRPAFVSPLLADVGRGGENGTGFRSSLLADIGMESGREGGASAFASSVFADLADEGRDAGEDEVVSGPTPVVGPEAPVAEGDGDAEGGDESEKKDGDGAEVAGAGSTSSRK